MPLPLAGGIPWLAGVLGSLMFSVVQLFAKYLTKRLALVAAAVVLTLGLTASFLLAIEGMINAVAPAVPDYFATAASWVVPDQTPAIVSAVVAARLARWVYEWNVKVIQWKLV
ncbi:DUF5455 family protein [Marinimicrobium agarilyticum]|uniref:DUF5455 family protein n=1 Tax=Marinimicrobium agarilyticum TaxID=306546 RepID=UPI00047FBD5B|nr:DUF5455 family protein [Marinimicrobium agarilyticum]